MMSRLRQNPEQRVLGHALLAVGLGVGGAVLGAWLAADLGAFAPVVGAVTGIIPGALLAARIPRTMFFAVRDQLDLREEALEEVPHAPSVGGRSVDELLGRVYGRHAARLSDQARRARVTIEREGVAREEASSQQRAARDEAEAALAAERERSARLEGQLLYLKAALRPPLTASVGAVEVALDSDIAPSQLKLLGVARVSLGTLGAVLDLLDGNLDRPVHQFVPEHYGFSPRRLVAGTLRALTPEAERRGVELVLRCSGDVPSRCEADTRVLEQALMLVMVWSLANTRAEHVTVSLGVLPPVDTALEGDVSLRVLELIVERSLPTDRGVALDSPLSLDPAKRSDAGPLIAARLLASVGGELRVEHLPGGTAQLAFTFPVIRQKRVTATTLYGRGAITDKAVLVVDDLAASRAALSEQLATWRLLPTAVDGTAAAIEALHSAHRGTQPFDAILIDRHMPGQDGLALLRAIASDPLIGPQRVVLLDHLFDLAHPLPNDLLALVAARILKPILPSELLEVLTSALAPPRSAPRVNTRPGLRPDPDKRAVKILVAEDNPVNQMFTARLLEKRGHHVTVASNGADVIDCLDTSPEPFDLVLMDIQMPVLDGLEATAVIRERERRSGGPRLPIIAVTAHAMHGEEQRILDAGLDGYIPKPVVEARLFEMIERVLPPGFHRLARRTPPDGLLRTMEAAAVFDEEKVLSFVAGDHEFLTTLVALFVETAPKQLTAIREAVERSDALALERAAHQLKGSVSNFAADRARHWAHVLEKAGRGGDLAGATDAVASLEVELTALGDVLGDLARRHPVGA